MKTETVKLLEMMTETMEMLEIMEMDKVKKDYPFLSDNYEQIAFALAGRLALMRREAEYYKSAYNESKRYNHEFI